MKYFALTVIVALASVFAFSQLADAVTVSDGGDFIKIETAKFELHWKKGAQMGYTTAIIDGIEFMTDDTVGRRLYHSSNYDGWKDWGALTSWEIVDESIDRTTVKFVSNDGGSKEYNVMATFYDGADFIRHELIIKNVGSAAFKSFASGHEPMFEPRVTTAGLKLWETPIQHVAIWTNAAFAALYTETGTARAHAGWQTNGRIDLTHDDIGADVAAGAMSDPLVYWVAFAKGGEAEATALAGAVTKPVAISVEPAGKLATRWGAIKVQR